MGVAAVCATLTYTLDEVIADGGSAVLAASCCALEHLQVPNEFPSVKSLVSNYHLRAAVAKVRSAR